MWYSDVYEHEYRILHILVKCKNGAFVFFSRKYCRTIYRDVTLNKWVDIRSLCIDRLYRFVYEWWLFHWAFPPDCWWEKCWKRNVELWKVAFFKSLVIRRFINLKWSFNKRFLCRCTTCLNIKIHPHQWLDNQVTSYRNTTYEPDIAVVKPSRNGSLWAVLQKK